MPLVPKQYMIIGEAKVAAAKTKFIKLLDEFAGENLIAQITAVGKTKLIADAVRDVVYYGSNGSLWEAYVATEKAVITPEMAPFLTEARKQEFKNKIVEIISSL